MDKDLFDQLIKSLEEAMDLIAGSEIDCNDSPNHDETKEVNSDRP